jgi:uncharacterized protein
MKKILILLVKIYQWTLSPYLGSGCRFYPSCSHYALEVIERFGAFRGSWLSIKRILKCHPFHPGGFDPAPITSPSKKGGNKKQGGKKLFKKLPFR